MQDFRKLKVWNKAHLTTLEIYRVTENFPQSEKFGLTSQLRRAASSIGANLAEGCGRVGQKDKARFFTIASGSASETLYHLILANDLGLVENERAVPLMKQMEEVKMMLTALIQKLTTANC